MIATTGYQFVLYVHRVYLLFITGKRQKLVENGIKMAKSFVALPFFCLLDILEYLERFVILGGGIVVGLVIIMALGILVALVVLVALDFIDALVF